MHRGCPERGNYNATSPAGLPKHFAPYLAASPQEGPPWKYQGGPCGRQWENQAVTVSLGALQAVTGAQPYRSWTEKMIEKLGNEQEITVTFVYD